MLNDRRALRDLTLDDIRTALKRPLPGIAAQIKLAPEYRMESLRATPPPDARPAGVLILLYPHNGAWYFPLMKRVEDGLVHSGQISLPGGSQEAGESLRRRRCAKPARRSARPALASTCWVNSRRSTFPPAIFSSRPRSAMSDQRPDFQLRSARSGRVDRSAVEHVVRSGCGEARAVGTARRNGGRAVLSNRPA